MLQTRFHSAHEEFHDTFFFCIFVEYYSCVTLRNTTTIRKISYRVLFPTNKVFFLTRFESIWARAYKKSKRLHFFARNAVNPRAKIVASRENVSTAAPAEGAERHSSSVNVRIILQQSRFISPSEKLLGCYQCKNMTRQQNWGQFHISVWLNMNAVCT